MPPKKSTSEGKGLSSVIEELELLFPQDMDLTKTTTGVLPVDFALGGGYSKGMFCELAGDSGTGKSTLALSIARSLAKRGIPTLYLNFEQATVQFLMETMGMMSLDKTLFCPLAPASISEGEECLKKLIYRTPIGEEPAFKHIFFDSIGAMVPDYLDDDDKDSTDSTPAVKARQLAKFFEIHTAKLKRRGICCWFVNHISLKIETSYGKQSEKKSKGGVAVEYWTDTRLALTKGTTLSKSSDNNVTGGYNDKDVYANIGNVACVKGRTGAMGRKTECPVFFGRGVSNAYWIYLILKNAGYIKTAGSYLKCTLLDESGVNLQGVPKMIGYIKEKQKEIISKMKKVGLWDFMDKDTGIDVV